MARWFWTVGLLGIGLGVLWTGLVLAQQEDRQCRPTSDGFGVICTRPGQEQPGPGQPGQPGRAQTPVVTQVPPQQTVVATVVPGRPGQTPVATPTPRPTPTPVPTMIPVTPTPCLPGERSLTCLPPDVMICQGPGGPIACRPTPTPVPRPTLTPTRTPGTPTTGRSTPTPTPTVPCEEQYGSFLGTRCEPAQPGQIKIDTQIIPGRDMYHCQEVAYYIDTQTGLTVNTDAREVPCPGVPAVAPGCQEGLIWDGTTITCRRDAPGVRLEARVPIPEVALTLNPWPASLVHWPNVLTLEPVDRPSAEAQIARWPAGSSGECTGEGDDAGTPRDGWLKDIRLTVRLLPYWQEKWDWPAPLLAALDFGPGGFVGGPAARVEDTPGGPVVRGPRVPNNLLWVEEGDSLTFALPIPSHPEARRYGYTIAPFPTTLDEEWAKAGTPSFVFRVLPVWRLWYQFSYQIAEGIYKDEERTVGFTSVTGPDGNQYSVPVKKTERVRKGCNWKTVTEGPHAVPTENISGLPTCVFGQPTEQACVWQDAIVTTKIRLTAPDGTAYQTTDGILPYIIREVQTLLVRPDLEGSLREWIKRHPDDWCRAIGRPAGCMQQR